MAVDATEEPTEEPSLEVTLLSLTLKVGRAGFLLLS